jgi:hypothetical protein
VRQTCEEFGITYLVYPTIGAALRGHVRTLREFGRQPGSSSAMHTAPAK